MTYVEKQLNLVTVWRAGKNPWITVANPNAEGEKAKRTIRVRSNDYWGNPRPKKKEQEALSNEG